MSGERGDFFAIDSRVWPVVCRLGLGAAVAYLVLARGTGRDMATTSWSVDAIERLTRVSRANAKRAINALAEAQALDRLRERPTPMTANYRLRAARDVPGSAAYLPPRPAEGTDLALLLADLEVKGTLYPDWAGVKHADELVEMGWATRAKTGRSRPDSYRIVVRPDAEATSWTWLPNALVDGVGDEDPPLELVRQMQDVPTLALLIGLYDAQDLRSYGGVHWRQIRHEFTAREVGRPDGWRVLSFEASVPTAFGTAPFVQPFLEGRKGPERDAGWSAFWSAWNLLRMVRLIELAPHLLDGDSDGAEVIHPFVTDGTPPEREVATEAWRAARRLIQQHDEGEACEYLMPVRPHQKGAVLVGIYRLKYRTKAGATAAWIAQAAAWQAFSAMYRSIAPRADAPEVGVSAA